MLDCRPDKAGKTVINGKYVEESEQNLPDVDRELFIVDAKRKLARIFINDMNSSNEEDDETAGHKCNLDSGLSRGG